MQQTATQTRSTVNDELADLNAKFATAAKAEAEKAVADNAYDKALDQAYKVSMEIKVKLEAEAHDKAKAAPATHS